jgi:hypothetical protein
MSVKARVFRRQSRSSGSMLAANSGSAPEASSARTYVTAFPVAWLMRPA